MKILHIIPSISEKRGGTSQAVLDIVGALQERNIAAEIVTTNDDGSDLLDIPLLQPIQYGQVPIRFFPRFSPPIDAIREFAFSSSLTTWLWQHITEYDLLHIHALFSYTCTVGMRVAQLKQIPYLNTPHGLLCYWSLQQSVHKKQIYWNLVERANLNGCRALHFTTQQEQWEVSRLNLTTPSFVLPLGISLPDPIPDARQRLRQLFSLPQDEPIILFLARLHYKKGLDYLIPALSKLMHHRFTFILAGDGDLNYKTQVESLLVATGLRDRTHLTGFVAGETKQLLLQGSDLFALTSHSENFGVAVLEAMASGLPVLVTPGVALAAEVAQYQLGYVPQLDLLDIVSTLEQYFMEYDQTKAMGQRAYQFVRDHYTWDKIAINLVQVYQAIIAREPISSFTEPNLLNTLSP